MTELGGVPESLPDELAKHEESFIPEHLRGSLKYIKNAREGGQGWPRYPGLPAELHSTAVSIAALARSFDSSAPILVASGASVARRQFPLTNDTQLADLVDLLSIALAEETVDQTYLTELLDRLEHDAARVQSGGLACSTKTISEIVMLSKSVPEGAVGDTWINLLADRQIAQSGAWPAVMNGSESLIATAWAIRALSTRSTSKSMEQLLAGANYLQSQVEPGWDLLTESASTYTLAVLLRALPYVPTLHDSVLDEGMSIFRSYMNPDGGWGGSPGDVSSVEYTALAVVTLLELGEGRFVPVRLVKEILASREEVLAEVRRKRDGLQAQLDGQVEELAGEVVNERNRLRSEVMRREKAAATLTEQLNGSRSLLEEMSKSKADLQRQLDKRKDSLDADRFLIPNPSPFLVTWVEISQFAMGVLLIAWSSYALGSDFSTWMWVVTGVFGLASLATAGLSGRARALRTSEAARRERLVYGDLVGEVSRSTRDPYRDDYMEFMLDSFQQATEPFPAHVKEELVYRLVREAIDLPSEFGPRYIRELMLEFRLPSQSSQRLEVWLERLLEQSPSTRRTVVYALRRTVL